MSYKGRKNRNALPRSKTPQLLARASVKVAHRIQTLERWILRQQPL